MSTLLQDLKEYAKTMRYPDPEGDGIDNCTLVEDRIVDTTRWFVIHEAVYLRKTVKTLNPLTFDEEFVKLSYQEPATEYQDWEEGSATVEEVVPLEETIIRFVPRD